LRHCGAGRSSNHAKQEKFRKQVLRLVGDKYSDGIGERFGPTPAAEHLASEDGLEIDAETLAPLDAKRRAVEPRTQAPAVSQAPRSRKGILANRRTDGDTSIEFKQVTFLSS